MSENIDIKVREDGSREAAVNIRAVGVAADESVARVGGLNQGLAVTRQAVTGAGQASQTAAQQVQQLASSSGSAASQVQQLTQNSATLGQQFQNFAIGATAVNLVADSITGLLDKLMQIPRAVLDAVQSMTALQAQIDKLRVGFNFGAGGDTFLGGANAEYINGLVQKLGLNINQTAEAFLKFSSATRGTALQGEQTREIFSAISEAAAVLHLNAEQTGRTFLALEQMASKGVVSMEELRRQLGDNLPGAFQIAARAMGVSTAELDKMIRSGTVLAEDFLPKFAEQVRKEFGGAVEEAANSAQASLGRFDTAWTNLKRAVADSGLGEAAKGQLDILTEALNGVTQAMQRAKSEGAGFWGQFGAGLKSFGQWFVLGEQNSNEGLAGRIKAINEELKRVDLDKFQRTQLVFDRDQAQRQLNQRTVDRSRDGTSDSIWAATALAEQQVQAVNAAREASLQRIAKYNEGDNGKYLTKQQRLDKTLATINDEFKAATKGIDQNSKEFAAATAIAAARKQEAMDKFNAAGTRKAAGAASAAYQNELSRELAEWQGYAGSRVRIEQEAIAQLQTARNEGEISEKEYLRRVGEEREKSLTDQLAIAEQQVEIAAGRKALAERERYVARVAELNQELYVNQARTAAAMSELERRTRAAGENALMGLMGAGDQRERSVSREFGMFGTGGNAADLERAIQQVQDKAAQARLSLDKNVNKYGTKDSAAYREALQLIDAEEQAQLERERGYMDQRIRMQRDWVYGASAALNEYADLANNAAKYTQDSWTRAFTGMEDAIVSFARTGKLDVGSMVEQIGMDLLRLQVRILQNQALSALFGSAFGQQYLAPTAGPNAPGGYTFNSGTLAGTGSWATGGYTGAGSANEVAGLVHKGEYVIKQDVVNQPGMLPYLEALNANGAPTPAAVPSGGGAYGQKGGTTSFQLGVVINNNASDKVQVTATQGQDENGNPQLDIAVDTLEGQLASRMQQGRGPLYKATQSAFGLRSNPRAGG